MSLENFPSFFPFFSEREMNGGNGHSYRFGPFRLDVGERQLLNDRIAVPLTPKAFEVLTVLVERAGHLVEKNELLNLVWADSFVEEINVARIVHMLRKSLGEDTNGNKFIETVAKKGYRFVAEVTIIDRQQGSNGHTALKKVTIPAVLPKHEVTKSGAHAIVDLAEWREMEERAEKQRGPLTLVPKEAETAEAEPATRRAFVWPTGLSLRISLAIFSIGVLAAGILGYYFYSRPAVSAGKRSIAVLPFTPIDSTNRNEDYEIGMADSVINQLAGAKDLIVRPLYATRKYADIEQDPIAAGKEQRADYVLAANYQFADGKIRITAQLYDVASGQIDETYKSESEAGSLFAMQDEITVVLAKKLLTRLALNAGNTTRTRGTKNEEAYRLYLQGKNLAVYGKQGGFKKGIECFEQAIRLDPNFARAYARMAFAYYAGGIGENSSENAAKVKEIVNKALELDPNLAEAYVARGFVSGVYDWDPRASEKDYLRALELEPNNDTAHWLYAMSLSNRGRSDEALAEIETAQTIDPGATVYMQHRGRILYYARRYDEAITQSQQVIDLDDRINQPYEVLSRVYEIKGDYASAYEFFLKREERSPRKDRLEIYQKVYETAGWIGVRRELAESLGKQYFDLARLYALQGENDAAFESLNKAVEKREWHIVNLKVEPAFDSLRGDPRFDELLSRVGFK